MGTRVVGAVLAAAGVLGCGADAPPTPTQYVASLEAVCRGKVETLPGVPTDPGDRVAVETFVTSVRGVVRRQLGAMRRLPRPVDPTGVAAVVAALERQLATLETADPVVASGSRERVAALVARIGREAAATAAAFRALGAASCALRLD